jgi:FSR family fosmidomycin resistance protein-like MFS transporter
MTILYLLIEFLDELVFGVSEAAWPLIRADLGLTYAQIGLALSMPKLTASLIEPFIGILGDIWRRRLLILAGGILFTCGLLITSQAEIFPALLFGLMLFNPSSGAFVSLSQASLMDSAPKRHDQNMARWTFAGSLGVVLGPILLGAVTLTGGTWRSMFFGMGVLSLGVVFGANWILPGDRSIPWPWQGLAEPQGGLFRPSAGGGGSLAGTAGML